MHNQEAIDMKMYNDNLKVLNDLKRNSKKIEKISNGIEKMYNNIHDRELRPIIEDIIYVIQSLNYMYVSCEERVKNPFGSVFIFSYVKFYREILSTTKTIFSKLKVIMKKNDLSKRCIINNKYNKINTFMEKELKWGAELEHDIDPLYNGKLDDILKELQVDKIIKNIGQVMNLIEEVSFYRISNVSFQREIVNYNVIGLEERKKNVSQQNTIFGEIGSRLNALSYVSQKSGLNKEGRNVVDIGFKYCDLSKSIKYIYKSENTINDSYLKLNLDNYSYFTRMAITLIYQIFDKFGKYLNNKADLELEPTYFKTAVKQILGDNKDEDSISKGLCGLIDSYEYKELNKLRQNIVHNKNKFIDYILYSEELSSLVVESYVLIGNVILMILDDFCKRENINVTPEMYDEVSRKTIKRKL